MAERTVIGERHLKGDAPGAAAVRIIVDERELVLPRCTLIDLMNVASNANRDERAAFLAKPLGKALGTVEISYDLAFDGLAAEMRCYEERHEAIDAISNHLRSRP